MRNSIEERRYAAARKKVNEIKGFYIHLAVYLFVNLAIIFMNSSNFIDGFANPSNYVTAFFWGIGLVGHWAGVFGSVMLLGRNWEEKKIQQLMQEQKKQQQKWE